MLIDRHLKNLPLLGCCAQSGWATRLPSQPCLHAPLATLNTVVFSDVDRAPMHALNEIIWKSVKGADSPMPPSALSSTHRRRGCDLER
jgi:hypothetical protein